MPGLGLAPVHDFYDSTKIEPTVGLHLVPFALLLLPEGSAEHLLLHVELDLERFEEQVLSRSCDLSKLILSHPGSSYFSFHVFVHDLSHDLRCDRILSVPRAEQILHQRYDIKGV